jgi:trimeric autotransporter adhesin
VLGSDNIATGTGANANGNDGRNIASGANANASGAGSSNIATGRSADASGSDSDGDDDGSENIATGAGANASGDDSRNIAVGAFANASGDLAQNVAIGANAQAIGGTISGSTAIGANARANFDNSGAFGAGATTTRANQQMFGTASNTYTMAGITSGASRTAQGAPTHLVTSNTGGDLAAHTFAELGLATTGDVAGLQTQINRLGRRDRELTEGIAAVAALAQPILLPGQHFAVRAGWGGYDDANAVGFSAAGVVASNLLSQGRGTLTLDGGLGFGTDEGEVAGRAGATIGW